MFEIVEKPVNRSLPPEVVAAIDATLERVRIELHRLYAAHPIRFHSAHEAWAVLEEKRDELWNDVKRDYPPGQAIDAIQVAAISARFIVDLLPNYAKAWAEDRELISDLGTLSAAECSRSKRRSTKKSPRRV